DRAVAERGKAIFDKSCASCHVGTTGTDNKNREAAPGGGHRNEGRQSSAHGQQGVSHDATPRVVAAPTVFPRWERQDARGCGGTLRPRSAAQTYRQSGTRYCI